MRPLLPRIVGLLRRRRLEADLDDEVRGHLDLLATEYQRTGLTREEARLAARRQFGSVEAMKERHRDSRGFRWVGDLVQDARHAARLLRKQRAFTAVAVVSLAVGIGANTAVVTLVEETLIRTLPVERPEELVFLHGSNNRSAPPYPYFDRLRREALPFTAIAAFAVDELKVEVDGIAEQVYGQVVSGDYFELLGLAPAAGRLMTAADERLDPPVAVIGYAYWQRRFGGTADAIGRTLTFDNRIYTIVGVTSASFRGLEPGRQVDVTLPITGGGPVNNPTAQWFFAVARLRPGRTLDRAALEANAAFEAVLRAETRPDERWRSRFNRIELTPAARGLDVVRAGISTPLYAMTAVAAILLLITCANLGGLLLVQGAARSAEFAVRVAIGAGAGRLLRQAVTETLLLFALGSAAGVLIAAAAVDAFAAVLASGRRPIVLDVQYNWVVAAYTAGLAPTAALLTGLWPAARALRTEPLAALTGGGHRQGTRAVRSPRRTLVAAQLALSFALVIVAALSARTMANIRAVDLGFMPRGVLTVSVQPERARAWSQILDRVRLLPGVRAASLSVLTPLSGRNTGTTLAVPGEEPAGEVRLNRVSDGYFTTFGIERLAGRTLTSRDAADQPKVVVLNETAANAVAARYFGGRSPVGRRVELGDAGVHEVVGVVRDHRHLSVREPAPPFAFVSVWQATGPLPRLTLSVASTVPPDGLARTVTDAVRAVAPRALVSDIITAERQVETSLLPERLLSRVAMAFAVVVLALAALGLYGTVSYSVVAQRAELAIRLALGAPRARVIGDIARDVVIALGVGVLVGLPLALVAARAGQRLLFGVSPMDPWSYLGGAMVLITVACAAVWLPARQACAIDPAETLRSP